MTGAPELLPAITEQTPHIILRDQVWEDYYYQQRQRICSRCGQYSKYEIIHSSHVINQGLKNQHNEEFFEVEFAINTTAIINKNSNNSEWGNLCNRCRNHILGQEAYPLSSSKADIDKELTRLKTRERARRILQDDDIKNTKTKLNKERREHEYINNNNKNKLEYPKTNPNDTNQQK